VPVVFGTQFGKLTGVGGGHSLVCSRFGSESRRASPVRNTSGKNSKDSDLDEGLVL
jgi:hypothetical protein